MPERAEVSAGVQVGLQRTALLQRVGPQGEIGVRPTASAAIVDHRHGVRHHVRLGDLVELLENTRQLVAMPDVVGVEERDDLP